MRLSLALAGVILILWSINALTWVLINPKVIYVLIFALGIILLIDSVKPIVLKLPVRQAHSQ